MAKREKKINHQRRKPRGDGGRFPEHTPSARRKAAITHRRNGRQTRGNPRGLRRPTGRTRRGRKELRIREMQVFATENRARELFTKRKSMETTHGIPGFRTGNPGFESPQRARRGQGFSNCSKSKARTTCAWSRRWWQKDKLLAERDLDERKVVMGSLPHRRGAGREHSL